MSETPILTSTDPDQLKSYMDFITELRANNVRIAAEEAKRLGPYFEALGTVLKEDMKAAGDATPEMLALTEAEKLTGLFNRVAASTKTTILSGLVIAPVPLFFKPEATEEATTFFAGMRYNDFNLSFGFIQAFDDKKINSVSVPVLAFDHRIMEWLAPHQPESMLKALQAVATAGNHDMQHHYTSTVLNAQIAQTAEDKNLPKPEFDVDKWFINYFDNSESDSAPDSYEAWLMYNHARVRRAMEEGPEGAALEQACDGFLAELKRIGAEMAAVIPEEKSNVLSYKPLARAHGVVDYLGTMMLFSMMRFMPLDHPLIDHVIHGLQNADPDPEAVVRLKDEIKYKIENPDKGDDVAEQTVANYRAKGVELMFGQQDYASLKKLQLINIEPWVAHLMSPGKEGSELAAMQERTGEANHQMLNAAAMTSWFNAVDGLHTTIRPDGQTMETWFEGGQLHRTDGAALVLKDTAGNVVGQQWFQDGRRFRAGGGADHFAVDNTGERTEIRRWHNEQGNLIHELKTCPTTEYRAQAYREYFSDGNGKRHRDNGYAWLVADKDGNAVEEEWHQHGILHRVDGPARTKVEFDGTHLEQYFQHGKLHREDGPAIIAKHPSSGFSREEWHKDGLRDRADGPALVVTFTTGAQEIGWYKNGKLHNDNGPAFIKIEADGTRSEKWFKNGEPVDMPVTAVKASKLLAPQN